MQGQQLKGHLELLLLSAISSGATHGYAIAQTLRTASDGGVDLQDGTIYPALRRLEHAGLVNSSWSDGGGRRRRSYTLTDEGEKALARERDEWTRFQRSVTGVLALPRT